MVENNPCPSPDGCFCDGTCKQKVGVSNHNFWWFEELAEIPEEAWNILEKKNEK